MTYFFLKVPLALIVKEASHWTLVDYPSKADYLILVGGVVLHGLDIPKGPDHVFANEVPLLYGHTSGHLILSQPVDFLLIARHCKFESS